MMDRTQINYVRERAREIYRRAEARLRKKHTKRRKVVRYETYTCSASYLKAHQRLSSKYNAIVDEMVLGSDEAALTLLRQFEKEA